MKRTLWVMGTLVALTALTIAVGIGTRPSDLAPISDDEASYVRGGAWGACNTYTCDHGACWACNMGASWCKLRSGVWWNYKKCGTGLYGCDNEATDIQCIYDTYTDNT